GTSQNFGQSIGVALIGSVLIASLTTGVMDQVRADPNIPDPVKSQIEEKTKAGVEIVSGKQVYDYMVSQGHSKSQAQKVEHAYESAQLEALKESLFFIAIFAVLSLFFSRGLPNQPMKNLKPE
ncbi:MAG: MFS transporter, partial [Actinomycetia bacterium]|nr:MFS transporter [Actinomycetes bacterium]